MGLPGAPRAVRELCGSSRSLPWSRLQPKTNKTRHRHRPGLLHLEPRTHNGRAERAAGRRVWAYKQQGSPHLKSCFISF